MAPNSLVCNESTPIKKLTAKMGHSTLDDAEFFIRSSAKKQKISPVFQTHAFNITH
jgi:hypothetical protein